MRLLRRCYEKKKKKTHISRTKLHVFFTFIVNVLLPSKTAIGLISMMSIRYVRFYPARLFVSKILVGGPIGGYRSKIDKTGKRIPPSPAHSNVYRFINNNDCCILKCN